MIPVSREFSEQMNHNTNFREQADITLANGTELALSESEFTLKNNNVSEGAGISGLPLGVAVCRSIQIEIKNDDDRYSDYDFFGARIHLYLTYQLSQSVEKIDYGFYTVTTPETYGTTVIIRAFDDMHKADKPYDTDLIYPTHIGDILMDACRKCGINQGDINFPNSNFVVTNKPKPKDATYRSIIGNIAMIAGGNARIDMQGYLRIKTYTFNAQGESALDGGNFQYNLGDVADGGNFTDYTSGDNYDGGHFGDSRFAVLRSWRNLKIETDDVVITGVKDKDTGYQYGVAGYVIEVKNPLYKGSHQNAINLIGNALIGARFRPFSGDCVANPIVEFMDDVVIHDRKGNTYQSFLTDVNFVFLGFTTLKNSATSAVRNSSKYNSKATEALIESRQLVEEERTSREQAVAQLAQELATSSGLYMTSEEQPDESYIYYMHNKPTLAQSSIIWRLTADAFAISTDGGVTYPYGFDVSGTAILNKIYAEGIDADYINTGYLSATRIKGGNLILGGEDDTFGQMIVKNATGGNFATLGSTGLNVGGTNAFNVASSGALTIGNSAFSVAVTGALTIGNNFSVTSSGSLTASAGRIAGFTINGNNLESYSGYTGNKISISPGSIVTYTGSVGGVTISGNGITMGGTLPTISMLGGKISMGANSTIEMGTGASISLSGGSVTVGNGKLESGTVTAYGSTLLSGGTNSGKVQLYSTGIYLQGSSSGLQVVASKMAFFSGTPNSKQTVSTITNPSSASASTCASKINDVINALKKYNLL